VDVAAAEDVRPLSSYPPCCPLISPLSQNDGQISDFLEKVHEGRQRAAKIAEREKMFNWDPSDFSELAAVRPLPT
jgi:hypothetical protein